MSFQNHLKTYFRKLSQYGFTRLRAGEDLTLSLRAEQSQFVRFNQAKVRQTTALEQIDLDFILQVSSRKFSYGFNLCQNWEADCRSLDLALARARAEIEVAPEDPYLRPVQNHGTSEEDHLGTPLAAADIAPTICQIAKGHDLAGLYCGGPLIRASANSKGQWHWFSTNSFFVDYSLYAKNVDGENKASRGIYSEKNFQPENFQKKLLRSADELKMLQRRSKKVLPGEYPVFLTPTATGELLQMLSWNAVSLSAYKEGNSAFKKFYDGEETLSPLVTVRENFGLGIAPRFNAEGELAPETLTVIDGGKPKNWLVTSRASLEYGVPSNGAASGIFGMEGLRSPELLPGELATENAISQLGTGLYLGYLHYLNWSSLPLARITGMTRYGCFWGENGEIVAPIHDLRFDESLYRCLGKNLRAVTREQDIEPSIDTYDQRSLGGKKVPGLLIDNFTFTL